MSGTLVMAIVAAALAIGAILVALRPGAGEKAAVRKRITATMMAAAAILLAAYAYALHGWDAGA